MRAAQNRNISRANREAQAGEDGGMSAASSVFILPLPTSVNAMYRAKRSRIHRSSEYKDWFARAAVALNLANVPSFLGRYGLDMQLPESCGDIDNRVKTLNDLLQARKIVRNDKHCEDIHISRSADVESGTCRVTIRDMN